MSAIVSNQLDRLGQYQIDVSTSTPLVEDPNEDPVDGKEIVREYHAKGGEVLPPKQTLDEEKKLLWNNWQERAKNMFGKREFKTAERYYGEAIAMCPDAQLYSNRAACRLAQGHAGRALDDAETALRYDSNHVKAFWRKGQALERMHMKEEAVEAYREGLKREPENTAFTTAISRCHGKDAGGAAATSTDPSKRGPVKAEKPAPRRRKPPPSSDAAKPPSGSAAAAAGEETDTSRPAAAQPNALANELQNKGDCSYYMKDRATEVAQREELRANQPAKEVTIAIEDWSWRDVDDKTVKVYAHFDEGVLDAVDEEKDIECEVGGANSAWNRIPLNMWVNTHREDGKRLLLHIPKLYERIRKLTCIKKRRKIMLVLEKVKYEAWPEIHWDESRDEKFIKPKGPPKNPLGLYDLSYRDERQTQYRRS